MSRGRRVVPAQSEATTVTAIFGTSRETLLAEKADYEKQLAQAQQEMTAWQQRALLASGALQAVVALLAKLDAPTEADPAS